MLSCADRKASSETMLLLPGRVFFVKARQLKQVSSTSSSHHIITPSLRLTVRSDCTASTLLPYLSMYLPYYRELRFSASTEGTGRKTCSGD